MSNFVATSCDHVRRAGEQIYACEDPDRQWHPRRNQEGEPLLIRQLDRAMAAMIFDICVRLDQFA